MSAGTEATSRPRLERGVRLREDTVRGGFVLLAPERVLKTNAITVEILKRCDGERTLGDIIDDLARVYAADRTRIAADVEELLADLARKRMVAL